MQLPYAQAQIHEAPNIEPHGHLSVDEEARLYRHDGLDYDAAGDSGAGSGFVAPETDKVDETREGRRRLRRHGAAE